MLHTFCENIIFVSIYFNMKSLKDWNINQRLNSGQILNPIMPKMQS